MLKSKHIDKICIAAVALALVLVLLFCLGAQSGFITGDNTIGYENRLFDDTKVHTLEIVMDDWDGFLETATSEEYSACTLVIDGEKYGNVGIRGKGNTSLTSVASYGNDRYSFKVEFDQYENGKSYYGLDKLSLNNLIADNTYMKDYLCYTMMRDMGVSSPLCSYVYITVNGEDWGLYLAVEGVEDSFLERNYGSDYGELYKPDSMSMGGGAGNGKDFDINDFMDNMDESTGTTDGSEADGTTDSSEADGAQDNTLQQTGGEMPEDFDPTQMGGEMPEGFDPTQMGGGKGGGMGGGGMGSDGMGSDDVKLKYIDDDPDSYSNIFDNAKTDITDADKSRLISSLQSLSEGGDVSSVVDVDTVIRYFVVHDFVCNGDSYTGSMIHNYYLYEENGVMEMIPWDYNLAFGGFSNMGGGGGGQDAMGGAAAGTEQTSDGSSPVAGENAAVDATDAEAAGTEDSTSVGDTVSTATDTATSQVNSPIDSPVSSGDVSDRPMVAWIFESEEYTALYHQYYAEFMELYFSDGYCDSLIDSVSAMIAPYVEKDPTAFCTYEEFELGVSTLKQFCDLRAESVKAQLDGTIPSTSDGQTADSSGFIDASGLDLTALGTQNMGGGGQGGGGGGAPPTMNGQSQTGGGAQQDNETSAKTTASG